MPPLKPLVAIAIAAIAAPCAPAQPSGVAQPMLSIPGDPFGIFRSLVDIDLDNDGDTDLAAAFLDYGSPVGGDEIPTMWTFLNNGDGSFTPTQVGPMPLGSRQMRAADLNNDGFPDVIAGCVSTERMAIFLGDGMGGLTIGPVLDTQGQPNNFDLSDLDNDGDLDLAVAIQSTGLVSRIFTNDGNANFTLAATQSTAPFICDSVVLYDIDRDGDDDWGLLRGTGGGPDGFPGSILFYENLGSDFGEWAGFGATPIASAGVGNTPFDVTEGDLDSVNGTDLVVANAFGSSITILLNDGAAGFLPPITFNLLPGLRRVHLADDDKDGDLDIITHTSEGSFIYTIARIENLGAGNFAPPVKYPTGPSSIDQSIVADLTNDGWPDFVAPAQNTIRIATGLAQQGYPTAAQSPVSGRLQTGAVFDINADGNNDAIFASQDTDAIITLLGDGQGAFTAESSITTGNNPTFVRAGDIDNDGDIDIITKGELLQLLINDNNALTPPIDIAPGILTPGTNAQLTHFELTDYDGDSDLDILFTTGLTTPPFPGLLYILRNDSNGNFTPGTPIDLGTFGAGTSLTGNFNNDADPDIAVLASSGAIILLSDGAGGLLPTTTLDVGPHSRRDLELADLDNDGDHDIITTNGNDRTVSILLCNGDGTFQPRQSFPTPGVAYAPIATDFNNDGAIDIVAVCSIPQQARYLTTILINDGAANFTTYLTQGASSPAAATPADLDNDGDQELLIGAGSNFNIVVLDGIATQLPLPLCMTDANTDSAFDPEDLYTLETTPPFTTRPCVTRALRCFEILDIAGVPTDY